MCLANTGSFSVIATPLEDPTMGNLQIRNASVTDAQGEFSVIVSNKLLANTSAEQIQQRQGQFTE